MSGDRGGMRCTAEYHADPSPAQLDAIEASNPRLVTQSRPGKYTVVNGPPRIDTNSSEFYSSTAQHLRDDASKMKGKDAADRTALASVYDARAARRSNAPR